jgi:hypothetical protein
MNTRRIKTAVGGIAVAGALAGAMIGTTTPSLATTKGPVSGYIMAWRQVPHTRRVLVAYRAKNNTSGRVATAKCWVHARPTVKIPKPYFYTFAPQKFALASSRAKFTYIGTFTLPTSKVVQKMWVSCS